MIRRLRFPVRLKKFAVACLAAVATAPVFSATASEVPARWIGSTGGTLAATLPARSVDTFVAPPPAP